MIRLTKALAVLALAATTASDGCGSKPGGGNSSPARHQGATDSWWR
jgi:hypothetical protein